MLHKVQEERDAESLGNVGLKLREVEKSLMVDREILDLGYHPIVTGRIDLAQRDALQWEPLIGLIEEGGNDEFYGFLRCESQIHAHWDRRRVN